MHKRLITEMSTSGGGGEDENAKVIESCLTELSAADFDVVRMALADGLSSEIEDYSGKLFFLSKIIR